MKVYIIRDTLRIHLIPFIDAVSCSLLFDKLVLVLSYIIIECKLLKQYTVQLLCMFLSGIYFKYIIADHKFR